jgi:hypothetical protein
MLGPSAALLGKFPSPICSTFSLNKSLTAKGELSGGKKTQEEQ